MKRFQLSISSASLQFTTTSRGGTPKLRGSIVLGGTSDGSTDLGRRLLQNVIEGFTQAAAAPTPAPALPRSRREVFEARTTRQAGAQQTLRNALALDTIEAFYDDKSDGPIRRLTGTGDPSAPLCPHCRVARALPMNASDAGFVRAAFRKAKMPAAMAYAFATTRVIVTEKNRRRLCSCDVAAWQRAIAHFQNAGAAAWRAFGVPL